MWQRSHECRHAVDYAHIIEKTDVTAPLRRVPGVRWGGGPPRIVASAKALKAAKAKTQFAAERAEAKFMARQELKEVGRVGCVSLCMTLIGQPCIVNQ
jgi:hypothetical protein